MTLTSPRGFLLERLEGNPGSMSYWSGLFTRVAGDLGELRSATQSATDLPGVGLSITAARDDAAELVSALRPAIAEAELLASVLQRYADAFTSSAEAANRLIDDIEDAHAEWTRRSDAALTAGMEALASSRTEADSAAEDNENAAEAVRLRDEAEDALDALWLEWESRYDSWDSAYDTALAELAGGTNVPLTADARTLLDDLLAANSAQEVRDLWLQHPELHGELSEAHPEIIGNLDGIPYADRHEANFTHLERVHESDLAEPLRSEIDALWNEIVRHGSKLIAFDPTGSGQLTAAVAIGDVDTADSVSVLISGMNSGVGDLPSWSASARALNEAVDGADGSGSSATVVWFGYDTPSIPEEPWMDRAEDGAAALRSFLHGLDVEAPSARTTVIAHSYGSTTAALAIGSEPGGIGVDNFIAVGSAGFPDDPQVLQNLQTGPQVYATLSEGDMWARIGRDTAPDHGTSPETLPGTIEFGSDGGYELNPDGTLATDSTHDGAELAGTPGHGSHVGGNSFPWENEDNGYLSAGTESFYNIQQIVITGEPGTSMDGPGSGSSLWDLPDWMPFDPYRF
ncbi:MAG: alpha/beta hydrolase [Microbacterium sp.]